ncbi:BQ5605_C014g07480 [Microbotryum silenes-dioicae]|uniref:BQ5605_C014g07480 protein n=1 Tax=Microbotryum silenes-dioicae TaxID=796604 RepID=A0A2X0NX70_9BASI|nr:BQ5605_C014g07480 [Microbotryum silenes-dioicae]
MSAVARSSLTRTVRLASVPRAQPAVRIGGRRFASNVPGTQPAQPSPSSHLASGAAGGLLVLGAIYGYYHYSGTAKVVNTARDTINAAASAKDKVISAAPSPSQALGLLRSLAKSYGAAVPGAGGAIDASFDQLEKLAEEHGEKVTEVIKQTYDDVVKATKSGKNAGEAIANALSESLTKIQDLVGAEGGKVWVGLAAKFPDLGKALGGQAEEFQKLAAKHGPEAQKLATDTYNEASKIVANGGLNAETLDAVKKLLADKTQEITALGQRAGSDAYAASAKAASPVNRLSTFDFGPRVRSTDAALLLCPDYQLLDKLPDVKSLLEDNLKKVEQYIGKENVGVVKDLYADLEKISKNGKSLDEQAKEAKKLVESRVGSFDELKKKGLSQAQQGLENIPGLGEAAKFYNSADLAELKKLAEKHGEKSKDILDSTYEEIKQILAKKVEEARKVGEQATNDAKKAAK